MRWLQGHCPPDRMTCDPVIRFRCFEFREIQLIVATAAIKRPGHEKFEIAKLAPVADPALVGIKRSRTGGELQPLEVPAVFGNDVDDGKQGIAAIQRGNRAGMISMREMRSISTDHGFIVEICHPAGAHRPATGFLC